MTPKQRAELRASEIRSKLSELGGVETLTDEQRTEIDELRQEYQDTETRIRALAISEDEPESEEVETIDSEEKEKRELRAKVTAGTYAHQVQFGRAYDGAEAEYNAAMGHGPEAFPLELLAPPAEPVEERATSDIDTVTKSSRWVDRLFADTAAMRIGISPDTVAPGEESYPITTGGASAAQRARSEAAADATTAMSADKLGPLRNVVSSTYNVEDDMRNPGYSAAIERDLRGVLTEGLDRAVFLGDDGASGTDADITGLMTATGLIEKEITQANKVKGSNVLQVFAELINGKAAVSAADIRTVLAEGAYQLWLYTLANTGASVDTTIMEFIRRAGIMVTTRGDLETGTDANDFGGFIGLNRGIEGAAAMPIWSSALLIRDPYGGATKGEVTLTLTTQWNFALIRASNFARLKFVA